MLGAGALLSSSFMVGENKLSGGEEILKKKNPEKIVVKKSLFSIFAEIIASG